MRFHIQSPGTKALFLPKLIHLWFAHGAQLQPLHDESLDESGSGSYLTKWYAPSTLGENVPTIISNSCAISAISKMVMVPSG